jgi:hypothetical protein
VRFAVAACVVTPLASFDVAPSNRHGSVAQVELKLAVAAESSSTGAPAQQVRRIAQQDGDRGRHCFVYRPRASSHLHQHLRLHDADEVRRQRPRKTAVVDRLVRRYDDLARDLLVIDGGVRLVGVDGCGGAGKTTFAARLADAAGNAPVVHTDDFASWDQPMQWWPRLLAEVVDPLLRGEPATFRPYDWVSRELSTEPIEIAPVPLVVIEGVGATRKAWRDRLVARIWVDAPREARLRRGLERDGAHMRDFWTWWMAEEDGYVAEEHPESSADLCVDGDPAVAHDPDTEFVEVR